MSKLLNMEFSDMSMCFNFSTRSTELFIKDFGSEAMV